MLKERRCLIKLNRKKRIGFRISNYSKVLRQKGLEEERLRLNMKILVYIEES